MTAMDTITDFITEYYSELDKLDKALEATEDRVLQIQQELVYIREKELPAGIRVRISTGDSKPENKARKLLTELQNEQVAKTEEIQVLTTIIEGYKTSSADKVAAIETSLFRQEKAINQAEAFEKMIQAKEIYSKALAKESKPLHECKAIQDQIDVIKRNAGMNVSHAPIEIPYTVKLEVTKQDVTRLVTSLVK